ncbi:hypothetical protein GDO81_003013 [Engystomops pustulosus]|uniref:Delta(3,5)-Delta(2,4)-dienoyl-CoA isomerase, mitochondrial n=1 Tax=Engystomops pustulosus TaxID=76066 RepID=A0AAV6ZZP1_ENGPU|nr:hypothetical protein GDO81_003013 [Engystomops pustulosus]
MNKAFWREMVLCFRALGEDSNCRAVVISGAGKMFTSGIDLMDLASEFLQPQEDDAARIAWNIRKKICEYQESFSVIEKCTKPVIAAVHNGCIGGGVDLVTACDIRYCSQDAYFQVKSRVFPDKSSLLGAAFDLASEIASKSPVAVQGTKVNLLYSRDHSVKESLDYMATWNMSMLQTQDIMASAQAALQKKTPKDVTFSKL